MNSSIPWQLSGMEALNSRFTGSFIQFLDNVIADAATHAGFLNMLSLMEHVGSRKIMLTQMKGDMSRDTLKHMAEETRHAFFFKAQAERIGRRAALGYGAEDMLCRAAALMYFGRLDAAISGLLDRCADHVPYLWVSLIVELRANWVYGLYQAALARASHPLSLRSILAEEKAHMDEMHEALIAADTHAGTRLPRFAAMETDLFQRFQTQLIETANVGTLASTPAFAG